MKRDKKQKRRSFLSTFIVFITIACFMQIGILTYDYIRIKTQDTLLIAILILVLIVLISVAVSIIDYYRRKIMIDKPVNIILNATEKISKGEFDNPIDIGRNYSDYNKYDLIMDNLNQMAKNLKSFEVLKSDFISNVSHEIKTPLSVIQNYAYCLKNCKLDKETSDKYLDTLILSTKRLSDLITNILKLNKLENQTAETEKEKFYLTRTIENAILEFESITERKNLTVNCDIDDVYILSNENYINIVLNNLISNAVKFTDNGKEIFISLKKQGDFAVITIKDTGIGISQETGKKIFEKFYQGDTSHATEGNGLGLTLVKKVIDILGGEISVSSEVNKGSIFTIKLKGAFNE